MMTGSKQTEQGTFVYVNIFLNIVIISKYTIFKKFSWSRIVVVPSVMNNSNS